MFFPWLSIAFPVFSFSLPAAFLYFPRGLMLWVLLGCSYGSPMVLLRFSNVCLLPSFAFPNVSPLVFLLPSFCFLFAFQGSLMFFQWCYRGLLIVLRLFLLFPVCFLFASPMALLQLSFYALVLILWLPFAFPTAFCFVFPLFF